MLTTQARITTAALLIISAAAFATGAAIERGSTSKETRAEPTNSGAAQSASPDASPSARSTVPSPSANAPSKPAPTPSSTPKATGGDGDNGESSPVAKTTQPPTTPTPTSTATPSATGDGDGEESASATPGVSTGVTGHSEVGENPATHSAEVSSETLLGVNPEAPALVGLAVLMSFGFAAMILTVRSRLVAVVIAVTMLVFTALDIREVVHQVNESRTGLASLAAVVALLHLGAAVAAIAVAREREPITTEVAST